MKGIFPVRLSIAVLAVILSVRPAGAFFGGGGGIKEGDSAPIFSGRTIDNQRLDYAQMKGKKVVVLEFWSIYCASCIEEMPKLIEIHNDFSDKGLVVIGVNLDSFGTQRVVKFMEGMETKINFPVVIDKDRKIGTMFGAMILPTTLVIDVRGKVRFLHVGYKPGDEKRLRNAIAQAVKEIKQEKRMTP
jgi:peroxiredoxin